MYRFIFVFLAIAVLVANCESPSRGCLDIEATNFEFSADKPCEDGCCVYPNLIISMNQEFDNKIWKQDTAYTNNLGQIFRIKNIAFYLSGMELSRQNTIHTVSDLVNMSVFSNNFTDTIQETFTDDFVLVRRIPLDNPVGTFRVSGIFDQFTCKLGLDTRANAIVSAKTVSGHPLNRQSDSLWLSPQEGFVWMQIVLNRDTLSATPPDTLRFTSADFNGVPLVIQKSGTFEHTTGTDFKISVTANYAKLFEGVNFANNSIPDWKMKILSNLSNTFEVD